jgi:hypothetical protein
MTDLETRLREAFRAEAARVQPDLLRELRVPPPRRLRRSWRRGGLFRGSRLLPWLAPLAAALAVVAAVSGIRLTLDGRAGLPSRATPDVSPAADVSPAVPPVPIPPFYVAANLHSQAKAWVYNSVTGQVISKVGVPGQLPIAITAAADDRTFVVVFQDLYRTEFTTFTRLTLSADGKPASFQKLRVKLPAGASFGGETALSPDGQTLALALSIEPSNAALKANPKAQETETQEIELISLRTEATRTWAAAPGDVVSELSWARGSQTLAFVASKRPAPRPAPPAQVRILNVSHPPGGLITSSALVRLHTAGGALGSMLVTDNGARLIAWVGAPAPSAKKKQATLALEEFSTRTGQRLRVLSRLRTAAGVPGYGQLFSADPSGQHLLIYSQRVTSTYTAYVPPTPTVTTVSPLPGSGGTPKTFTQEPQAIRQDRTESYFARIDNGQVTRLPSPAQDASEFGAW